MNSKLYNLSKDHKVNKYLLKNSLIEILLIKMFKLQNFPLEIPLLSKINLLTHLLKKKKFVCPKLKIILIYNLWTLKIK